MRDILKAAWHTPGLDGRVGLPLMFRGAPGVGKSSQMRQIAAECGLPCEVVLASVREPADFLGLPIPVRDEADRDAVIAWMRETDSRAEPVVKKRAGATRADGPATVTFTRVTYAPPAWAVRLAQAGNAVGFMDEISSCPPSIQAALLRVILEGVVGDCHLPAGVRWVAAGNPTATAAGGWDIAAPLANRFGHLQWPTPTVDQWTAYLTSRGGDAELTPPADLAGRLAATWENHFPTALGTVSAFLRARPNLLLSQPADGDPKASEAWPSPRSWHMAVHAWAGANVHGLSQSDRELLVAAFVGAPAMVELCSFAEHLDLPDPARLLDGEVTWKHAATRVDRTVAVLSACTAYLVGIGVKGPKAPARAEAFWKVLRGVCKDGLDLVVEPARAMHRAKFSRSSADATDVLRQAYPLTDAADRAGV